jgi:hypothetical protein
MSKLETNTIDTVSGTSNLVIGSTNTSTITMPNGALSGQNYPAFEAYLSADQSVTDAVFTKVAVDTEVFDTDNCYDNTTNYRFTPTVAGKYFVQGKILILSSTTSNLVNSISEIRKNGSSYIRQQTDYGTSRNTNDTISVYGIIEMNGTTDYLELWGRNNVSSGGSPVFYGNSANLYRWTGWGAYRIGA